MVFVVVLVALAGCNALLGVHELPPNDGGVDTTTVDGETRFGAIPFEIRLTTSPGLPKTLTGTLDTDTSSECSAAYDLPVGNPWCVVTGTSITVGALRVVGSRPIVLVSMGDLTIAGTLDASSHRGAENGPAANSTACATAGIDGAPGGANGAGGGAGGSFETAGGNGGLGQGGSGGTGAAAIASEPGTLRGGCPGGRGGSGTGIRNGTSDLPGSGGGAVYLAGNVLQIDGVVAASGAGGGKGTYSRSAGSGGGSGGMILLWARSTITGAGTIVANGGGGGGGADNGADGTPGNDPMTSSLVAAPGGPGGGNAPTGGAGATGTSGGSPGGAVVDNPGAGGGGGGCGVTISLTFGHSFTGPSSPPL